jgi:hypothetical protein
LSASRVLHLVDPQGPGAAAWLCALARSVGRECGVVALGSSRAPWADARVPVPAGSVALAGRALERLCDARDAALVVAWGARACEVAVRARDAADRALVIDGVVLSGPVAFDAELVCMGDAAADRMAARGWPPMRVRVVPPPTPFIAEPDAGGVARRAWRQSRGIAEGAMLVGLLPSAPGSGDAWNALHSVGRVRMAGIDAALVLDPSTAGAGSTQAFARSIGMRDAIHFEPLSTDLPAFAHAVDAWLSLPDAVNDGTALDPAVAAGAFGPIVARAGSLAACGIDPGVDGLVAEVPNGIAAALLELADSPARRRSLASAARVRHASGARREAFVRVFQELAARASMRARSASAASA